MFRMLAATATATAAALLAAGAASAQDPLAEGDVEAFMAPLAERAQAAVDEGNWFGIQRWLEEHIADDATVAFDGSFTTSAGPVMAFQLAMSGRQYEMFSQITMAMPQMMDVVDRMSDYTIHVDLSDVTPLANGQATATVVVRETGMFDFATVAEADAAAPANVVFDAVHTCRLRLRHGAQDGIEDLEIVLAACKSDTMM